ncbi:unnamed protein product [Rhizoctonia solani]|uniref:F-box domain-containing protein n=1 Tax=Rhizoctonia solani TaxID=456999 RepID=A0A8H3DQ00_9AGAM|nr:unnamed protein product [Rhizoctonia solani]
MDNSRDNTVTISTAKLGTASPATTLFMVGTPTRVPSSKYYRSSILRATPARSVSSQRSKPTENNKPNNRPIIYGTARPKPKPDNKPIAQAVPLAFPASTSFVFNAPNADAGATARNQKHPIRAIQVLPTDVLILVIRSIEPNRHHQILKDLSLVSRVLNAAIAPILYHNIRLFNLKEVYDFALNFRHPTAVTSLEMFLTPDPRNLGWSPPDTNWTDQLVETLIRMERLMALTIKRCSNSAVLDSIIRQSNNPNFLPALQRLSFGYWHQLTHLAMGRALTSYGLAFDIQDPSNYESLDRALIALKSSESIMELKLTVTFTDRYQAYVDRSSDCRGKIMHTIIQHFPHLRSLVLRTQSRKNRVTKRYNVADILKLIPQKMEHLKHLELSDLRSPQYRTEATIKVATKLSAVDGLCPQLEWLNLDGLPWKRAPASPNIRELSFDLSRLTLIEEGKTPTSQDTPSKVKSDILLPEVTWTPCPSNPRGLTWWAKKAPELRVSSRIHSVFLLREWMLKHWDQTFVPIDDSTLDRAIPCYN